MPKIKIMKIPSNKLKDEALTLIIGLMKSYYNKLNVPLLEQLNLGNNNFTTKGLSTFMWNIAQINYPLKKLQLCFTGFDTLDFERLSHLLASS